DLLPVDVSAVSGIEIPHDHVIASHQNLTMMTGNRRFGDLKSVILYPADSRLVRLQVVGASCHSGTQENEFGHKSLRYCRLSPPSVASQIQTGQLRQRTVVDRGCVVDQPQSPESYETHTESVSFEDFRKVCAAGLPQRQACRAGLRHSRSLVKHQNL